MNPELEINRGFSAAKETIGAEETPVIVIDRWLDNADALKSCAPRDPHAWVKPTTLYPGLWAATPESYLPALMSTLSPIIAEHFGIEKERPEHVFSCYAIITKPPEALSNYQRVPHFDTLELPQIAVLHYLCDEQHGGTAFYRHKKTGYESVTRPRWDQYRSALEQEFKELEKSEPRYCDETNDYFEKIAEHKVKFDRLLVYPSQTLHTGLVRTPHVDSKDMHSGRLTVTSFISYY